MNFRRSTRIWVHLAAALSLFVVAITIVLALLNGLSLRAMLTEFVAVLLVLGFWCGVVGWIVCSRQPHNRVGQLLLLLAVGAPLAALTAQYARYALITSPGSLPAGETVAWLNLWVWVINFTLFGVFLPLWFPTGHPPGPRWRWVGWLGAAAMLLVSAFRALAPISDPSLEEVTNPYAWERFADQLETIGGIGFILLPLAIVAALASLMFRYAKAGQVERLQLKWILWALSLIVLGNLATLPLVGLTTTDASGMSATVELVTAPWLIIAVGIAILRYRLFDIDVVINKTLVFVSLAVLITVVYVGIVVGVGRLVGAGDEPSLLLSIVATSVVAVGFQPARRRLQRWANRVVFGERATPYEMLAGFSHQAADTGGDVFGEVCRLLVEGTAAEWAAISRVGATSLLAVWPEGLSVGGGVTRSITHEGEVMGELEFGIAAGESLTSAQSEVVDHLVAALGLLLRNAQMTAELQTQVHQLEESRNRIVAAGDEVRRRIETQLTEGPLATLDEIVIRLQGLDVGANGSKTGATVESVTGVIDQAKQAVLDFAQGVFPPVLEEHGLEGALRQRADTAPLPVVVESNLTRRYPPEIEAALYFIGAEALQNTIKYANATQAVITLTDSNGDLTLVVSDDGEGFDPATVKPGSGTTNTTQRIDTIGGTLTLTSTPGTGTTLRATVPRSDKQEELTHAP